MSEFSVPDMSCGHCKAAIERALASLDPAAVVAVDLAAKRVSVQTDLPDAAVSDALAKAGYPASAIG